MNKEKKYPIRYAVLELKESGGWSVGYKDIIRGYIASKCYVVESIIKYLPNGEKKITHKVVFPLTDLETFKLRLSRNTLNYFNKDTVKYDACNNPYSSNTVDKLFDSYEEAKKEATQKNEDLENDIIFGETINISINSKEFKEKCEKVKTEIAKQLFICELFEQVITENTEDMEITEEYLPLVKKKIKTT